MLTLYDYLDSGNGYKVRLALHQLGHDFTLVEKDILAGETRTEEFLALNPNGRIPTLVLADGTALAESNAILFYLGEGTALLPDDRLERARVLQWMFFEQYSHEPFIAVLRFWVKHGGITPGDHPDWADKQGKGYAALAIMETRLSDHQWLAGAHYSIADIALFAYSHVAHEGGYDLTRYPAVRGWITRVQAQSRHIPITWRPDAA